ncbi:hypothetical protein B7Y94_03815 [Candidatus Saccharibacteria bacterium 32-49-12]|nr:MAG: hypothetical protein B7Y94_03815 [Candidatus Saccharibacteria bacterium 32-49-12]
MTVRHILLASLVAVLSVSAWSQLAVYAQADNANSIVNSRRDAAIEARQKAADKASVDKPTVTEKRQLLIAKAEEKKFQIKQAICERRQDQIMSRMSQLPKNATSIKQNIDKAYDRTTEFYETGKLTTNNYDSLVTAIESAKAEAELNLELVSSVEPQISCEANEMANQLHTYRLAVQQSSESLKSYRTSVVDLISDLNAADKATEVEETRLIRT